MRIDLYTKLILTLIAISLTTIACKSISQPSSVAAEGPFAGVQFSAGAVSMLLFDSKTGDVWAYSGMGEGNKDAIHLGKIAAPGKPLLVSGN